MKALIFGISGQDGSYLAELLLSMGYEVYGVMRSVVGRNLWRLNKVIERVPIIPGDITDFTNVLGIIQAVGPDEVYNLAAQSFVGRSWLSARNFIEVNGIGALNIFEACRGVAGNARIYQASSSEMFGHQRVPHSELTTFNPESPYGASKLYAHNMANIYRNSHKMFIVCGIAFNHESDRRHFTFVSKKISMGVAKIAYALSKGTPTPKINLGTLNSTRDWGYAPEYVSAIHQMLQQEHPRDYVIATGSGHTVLDWLRIAFEHIGITGDDNVMKYVEPDQSEVRPSEVSISVGDPSRINSELGWRATKQFKDLVIDMLMFELDHIEDMEKRAIKPGKTAA